MKYDVRLQPAALQDLDEAFKNAAKHAPLTANAWLDRFYDTLQTLSVNPTRCGLAPENPKSKRTLHQLLFGKRTNVFRVIFTVEEKTVWIIRIRRASRRRMSEKELGESNE
jgi:plasmid stabilization system protein ParE